MATALGCVGTLCVNTIAVSHQTRRNVQSTGAPEVDSNHNNRKEDGKGQLSIRGGGGQELPGLPTIQELPLDLTCMGAKSYPWLPTMQELPLHRLHRLQM
jgi:hypothetical protein